MKIGQRAGAMTVAAVLCAALVTGCSGDGGDPPPTAAPLAPPVAWLDDICHGVAALQSTAGGLKDSVATTPTETAVPFATLRTRVQSALGSLTGSAEGLRQLIERPAGIAGSPLQPTRDALIEPNAAVVRSVAELRRMSGDVASTRAQDELGDVLDERSTSIDRVVARTGSLAAALRGGAASDPATAALFAAAPACAPYLG